MPLSPLGDHHQSSIDGADRAQLKRSKKSKQVRLLLDARTELTNEELEVGFCSHPLSPDLDHYSVQERTIWNNRPKFGMKLLRRRLRKSAEGCLRICFGVPLVEVSLDVVETHRCD